MKPNYDYSHGSLSRAEDKIFDKKSSFDESIANVPDEHEQTYQSPTELE